MFAYLFLLAAVAGQIEEDGLKSVLIKSEAAHAQFVEEVQDLEPAPEAIAEEASPDRARDLENLEKKSAEIAQQAKKVQKQYEELRAASQEDEKKIAEAWALVQQTEEAAKPKTKLGQGIEWLYRQPFFDQCGYFITAAVCFIAIVSLCTIIKERCSKQKS